MRLPRRGGKKVTYINFQKHYTMSKKFCICIAAAMLVACSHLSLANERGPEGFKTNRILDNIFVSAGAGFNAIVDNGSGNIGGWAADISAGKWFTPSVGVSFGVQTGTNKAQDTSNGWFAGENTFSDTEFHGEFRWNASNCLGGYKDRLVSVVPFLRAGVLYTKYQGDRKNEFCGGAGLEIDLRLAKRVSLFTRGDLTFAREETYRSAGKAICFPSVIVGATVQVGRRTGFDKFRIETVEVIKTVDNTDYQTLRKLQDELEYQKGLIKTVPVTDTVEVYRPEIVYFNIDKDWLTEREQAHLEYFVRFLPDGVTLTVTGHADKETGNPRHNMGLSQRRADTVVRTLTELGARFGKAIKVAKGDTANMFNTPEKNRCAIIEISK